MHDLRLRSLACALVLATAAGCGAGEGPAEGDADPANVVLVVIDTLRRDHLGLHGHGRETSPELDRFAAGAVVFERAYSTSPWTRPAVASILTGLYPSGHRAMALNNVLSPDVETLAETFASAGYATAGIVSHVIVSERFGIAQGFERWDEEESRGEVHSRLSTPGVTDRAIATLEALSGEDRPFFLFVHYFDPHYVFRAHPEIGFEPTTGSELRGGEDIESLRKRRRTLAPEDLDFLRARYDEEIRFTDAGFGRLMAWLDAAGLADDTVVAVTADHGEEFMERGWIGHTRTLYEELIAVPLVVRGRGGATGHGQRVGRPVSVVSVAPTLLELAGVDAGERTFEGPSLAPFVAGGKPPVAGLVFAEVDFRGPRAKQAKKKAVIGSRFKLIRDDKRGRIELYDLEQDPNERRNLVVSDGPNPAVDAMQRELYRFTTRELPEIGDEEATIEPDLHEQLRQLGYVEGEPSAEPEPAGD